MNTITLYRKYLHNVLMGHDDQSKFRRLSNERRKINDIVRAVDNCFLGDMTLTDKMDKQIYTLIKREIIREMARNEDQIELVAFASKYYLLGLINEIDEMRVSLNV